MKTHTLAASGLGLLLACASTLAPPPCVSAEQTVRLGRFAIGMSFEEARAAAPDLRWHDGAVSKYTGKALSITADDAGTIGGLSHSVELAPGYYSWYAATFQHTEAVTDAAACERLTLPVVADLEKSFGEFWALPQFDKRPLANPSDMQRMVGQLANLAHGTLGVPITRHYGAQTRVGEPRYVLVEVGKKSLMSFETKEDADELPRSGDPAWRIGIAEQMRPRVMTFPELTIRMESYYTRNDSAPGTCRLTTAISRTPLRPPMEKVDLDASMFAKQPSIALKHLTLDGVQLSSPVVELKLYCGITRSTGYLDCSRAPGERAREDWVIAAIQRTRAMRLDPARLDPDNPVPLRTTFKVVLAQDDRRPLDFLDASALKMSAIEWTRKPSAEDLQAAYPLDLLRQGQTSHVRLRCRIEADLSPLCIAIMQSRSASDSASEIERKFAWAARAIMTLYAAAPSTRSGSAAAGAVFDTELDFRPDE
jgi:hypothetical protein